jgi:predicted protein tyrosine phosphatase
MKVLAVCDQGNNRSVTVAAVLKYRPGMDVLTAGLQTNSGPTLVMLCNWADIIITTARDQKVPCHQEKVRLCDIGPDVYPRPFNPQLLRKVRLLVNDMDLS